MKRDPELVARWAALVLALVALVGTAVTLGVVFAPVVGWLAALAVTLVPTALLWRRRFDEHVETRQVQRDIAARPAEGIAAGLRLPPGPPSGP